MTLAPFRYATGVRIPLVLNCCPTLSVHNVVIAKCDLAATTASPSLTFEKPHSHNRDELLRLRLVIQR